MVGEVQADLGAWRKLPSTSAANKEIHTNSEAPLPTKGDRLCRPPRLILLDALHAHLMSAHGRHTLKVMVTATILQLRAGTVLLNKHLLFILVSLSSSSHLVSYII